MRIILVLNSMLISAGVGFNIVILRGRSKYKNNKLLYRPSKFLENIEMWANLASSKAKVKEVKSDEKTWRIVERPYK